MLKVLYHVRLISYDSHGDCTPPLNPLPAGGEGRQSAALALWGSCCLTSNQADMILLGGSAIKRRFLEYYSSAKLLKKTRDFAPSGTIAVVR
ncbi:MULTISPECIES: hypothetical protein [Nostoc]|uniref:Uncharacterized protein n=1 Tax=Nostoc paludosum FACHB-159 TaxID=2692908 RepID=A0ABR8JY73_9NOSO|nr:MULTISPECIES: hypothetical protein [Nostoc]MBD2676500.1 hypothetical protein [Nostoc sp. FACHB-857]MBD2732366.1 hypothetical protein [Nostoc paludosum FACHB-159]